MTWRSSTYLFLAGGSIVLIGLALFGPSHFRKPVAPQVPQLFTPAVIIEIDSGFSARQVVDRGVVVKFINDNDTPVPVSVPVSFQEAQGPCNQQTANQVTWVNCDIAGSATGVYHFLYCSDLKSLPAGANPCKGPLEGELRVRDHKGGPNELPESSVHNIYLALTESGQVNHFVLRQDNLEWADRNNHMLRPVYFPPPSTNDPCGASNLATTTCTILNNAKYSDYDYDCPEKGCLDPTLHVRSQSPNPTTLLPSQTPGSGSN